MAYSSRVILILLLFVSLAATKDGVSATCGDLPIRVEWIIPVGCDCSGFLLEFLGVAAALRDALRARGVDYSACIEKSELVALLQRVLAQ